MCLNCCGFRIGSVSLRDVVFTNLRTQRAIESVRKLSFLSRAKLCSHREGKGFSEIRLCQETVPQIGIQIHSEEIGAIAAGKNHFQVGLVRSQLLLELSA